MHTIGDLCETRLTQSHELEIDFVVIEIVGWHVEGDYGVDQGQPSHPLFNEIRAKW